MSILHYTIGIGLKKVLSCLLLLLTGSSFLYAQSTHTVISKPGVHNPALTGNFADPTVIRVGDKYYAYATNATVDGVALNIQVASSADLKNWKREGDALPQKPSWAKKDFWAPHVLYDNKLKKYVLFYSGESNEETSGKCLGVAFSDKPAGPFIDKGEPLVKGDGFMNIDPMAIIDPKTGKKLLYWGSGFQPIKVQEMNKDWKSFKSGTTALPVVWPGKEKNYDRLIEGAWIDYEKGMYYLYYSGDNCCGDKANYAVMVARAANAFGPFERLAETNGGSSVILEKDSTWFATGHNSIIRDKKGNVWMAYHAIDQKKKDEKRQERVLCLLPVAYKNGWPRVIKNGNENN